MSTNENSLQNVKDSFYEQGMEFFWNDKYEVAITFFEKSAFMNSYPPAFLRLCMCSNFSHASWNDRIKYEHLCREHKYWFVKQAMETKDATAEYHMSLYYDVIEHNYSQLMYWGHRAADKGHSQAQNNLGRHYQRSGKYDIALHWYQQAANNGLADAMYCIGHCYWDHTGQFRDWKKAFQWFQKSAALGNMEAAYNLVLCYQGKGCVPDFQKAAEICQNLAEKGLAKAQHTLGNFYYNGIGLKRDHRRAVHWFLMAAHQRFELSFRPLALSYEFGEGISQDYQKALYWIRQATSYPRGKRDFDRMQQVYQVEKNPKEETVASATKKNRN